MTTPSTPDVSFPAPQSVSNRWGKALHAGFTAVPNVLLKAQAELGLTNAELIVLLNVMMHWWLPDKLPFPRSNSIAERMNTSPRTVQRALSSLADKGLVRKVYVGEGPKRETYIDLSPLKEALERIVARYSWQSPSRQEVDDPF